MDGNKVTNRDLFKDHKVTMVNIWATWCGNCVDELPALEELNKEMAGKDCQVIGVCLDANESPDRAKEIIKEKGVTYKNVVPSDKLLEQVPVNVMPITYFVDSEGRVLTSPVNGADFEMYSEKLEEALDKAELS